MIPAYDAVTVVLVVGVPIAVLYAAAAPSAIRDRSRRPLAEPPTHCRVVPAQKTAAASASPRLAAARTPARRRRPA